MNIRLYKYINYSQLIKHTLIKLKHLPKPEVLVITRKVTKISVHIIIVLEKQKLLGIIKFRYNVLLPSLTFCHFSVKGLDYFKYADNKYMVTLEWF